MDTRLNKPQRDKINYQYFCKHKTFANVKAKPSYSSGQYKLSKLFDKAVNAKSHMLVINSNFQLIKNIIQDSRMFNFYSLKTVIIVEDRFFSHVYEHLYEYSMINSWTFPLTKYEIPLPINLYKSSDIKSVPFSKYEYIIAINQEFSTLFPFDIIDESKHTMLSFILSNTKYQMMVNQLNGSILVVYIGLLSEFIIEIADSFDLEFSPVLFDYFFNIHKFFN